MMMILDLIAPCGMAMVSEACEWSAPGWKSSSFPKRVVESFSPRQKKCLKNAKIARIVLTALGFF